MDAAQLYLAVSERLLRLRCARPVSMDEEGYWTEVLEILWDDLDDDGQEVVEEGIRAHRDLIEEGVKKQREFETR